MTVQMTDMIIGAMMFYVVYRFAPVISDMVAELGAGAYPELLGNLIVPFLFMAVIIAVYISAVRRPDNV